MNRLQLALVLEVNALDVADQPETENGNRVLKDNQVASFIELMWVE